MTRTIAWPLLFIVSGLMFEAISRQAAQILARVCG